MKFSHSSRPSAMSALAHVVAMLILVLLSPVSQAQDAHQHHPSLSQRPPQSFVASTDKPFGTLMSDAMGIMDRDMTNAPMNGHPDHDFAAMMIPHHQGAVDMAKIELLYGKDPVLRRLAQEIIVTQASEIAVMRAQLEKSLARDGAQHH